VKLNWRRKGWIISCLTFAPSVENPEEPAVRGGIAYVFLRDTGGLPEGLVFWQCG